MAPKRSTSEFKLLILPLVYWLTTLGCCPFSWSDAKKGKIELKRWSLRAFLSVANILVFFILAIATAYVSVHVEEAVKVSTGSIQTRMETTISLISQATGVSFYTFLTFSFLKNGPQISEAWNRFVDLSEKTVCLPPIKKIGHWRDIGHGNKTFLAAIALTWVLTLTIHVALTGYLYHLLHSFLICAAGSVLGFLLCAWTFTILAYIMIFCSILETVIWIYDGLKQQLQLIHTECYENEGKVEEDEEGFEAILRNGLQVEECLLDLIEAVKYQLVCSVVMVSVPMLLGSFLLLSVDGSKDQGMWITSILGKTSISTVLLACIAVLVKLCSAAHRAGEAHSGYVKAIANVERWDRFSQAMVIKGQNIIIRMSLFPLKISPGGYFNIDTGLLTSLATGAVTYMVILVQFNSEMSQP